MSKEMGKIELLQLFRNNIIQFFSSLNDKFPSEPDFMLLKFMFQIDIPIEDAVIIFCKRILPHAKMVETQDDRFFLECTDLFEGIRREKVHYFKDLWQSPTITDEDKTVIWKWFKLFLKLAQKYATITNTTFA
jgi:hypothetical protein